MRPTRYAVLALVVVLAAACSSGGGSSQSASAAPSSAAPSASVAPSVSASATASASASASPSADACATGTLATKTAGKLTIGTDNPAYPPYYLPRDGGNTDPWDKDQGDPTTGKGFESSIAYAVAHKLGFADDAVTWVVVPFTNSFAPGPKTFDFDINQVANKPERAQGADLSESYYDGNQAVIVAKGGKFASATTLSGLKDAKLGAQIGTTSLDAIENVIKPTAEAMVYDTNDAAIAALKAKQIDGIVIDLPTAFFVTEIQTEGNTIIGQIGTAAGATPEQWSLVLEKDSPITACVNAAVTALRADGTLTNLRDQWLEDKTVAELQP
jgi:polar amino acid transport system substrate-binding protein